MHVQLLHNNDVVPAPKRVSPGKSDYHHYNNPSLHSETRFINEWTAQTIVPSQRSALLNTGDVFSGLRTSPSFPIQTMSRIFTTAAHHG